MGRSLSVEIESQIRALCESIAQRDQLGEDVQEELRGHIEDKVLGYLDGKEALTEEDALLLAREHFGNPDALKAALFKSKGTHTIRSVMRRIAIAAFVLIVVRIAVELTIAAILLPTIYIADIDYVVKIYNGLKSLELALVSFGFWLSLNNLVYPPVLGFRIPVDRLPMKSLVLALAVVAMIDVLVPAISPADDLVVFEFPSIAEIVLAMAALLAQGLTWLWWCDRASCSIRSAVIGAGAWALVMFGLTGLWSAVSLFGLSFSPAGPADMVVMSGVGGSQLFAVWSAGMEFKHLWETAKADLTFAGIVLAVYISWMTSRPAYRALRTN